MVVLVAFRIVVKVVAKPLLRLLRRKPPKPPPGPPKTKKTKQKTKQYIKKSLFSSDPGSPGPSPRLLRGVYLRFSTCFEVLEGKTYQRILRKTYKHPI